MSHMPSPKTLSLGLHDPLCVVATDPEAADWSNPRGEIIRPVYSILAEHVDGRRWVHYWSTQDKEAAERLLERCRARVAAGHRFDPDLWTEIDPSYGSDAYIANEAEIVAAERQRDRDQEGA